jgi:hypothetical protein
VDVTVTVVTPVPPGAVTVVVAVFVTVLVIVLVSSLLQAFNMLIDPIVAPPTTSPASFRNSLLEILLIFSSAIRISFYFMCL